MGYNASDMKREWRGVRLAIRCETGVGGNARPGVRPIKTYRETQFSMGLHAFSMVLNACFTDVQWVACFSMIFHGFAGCFPWASMVLLAFQ